MSIFTFETDDGRQVDIEADDVKSATTGMGQWAQADAAIPASQKFSSIGPPKTLGEKLGMAASNIAQHPIKAPIEMAASGLGKLFNTVTDGGLSEPEQGAEGPVNISVPQLLGTPARMAMGVVQKPFDAAAAKTQDMIQQNLEAKTAGMTPEQANAYKTSYWNSVSGKVAEAVPAAVQNAPMLLGALQGISGLAKGLRGVPGEPVAPETGGIPPEGPSSPPPGETPPSAPPVPSEAPSVVPPVVETPQPEALPPDVPPAPPPGPTAPPIPPEIDALPGAGATADHYRFITGQEPMNDLQPGMPAEQYQLEGMKETKPGGWDDDGPKASVVTPTDFTKEPGYMTLDDLVKKEGPETETNPAVAPQAANLAQKADFENETEAFFNRENLPVSQENFKGARSLDPIFSTPYRVIPRAAEAFKRTFDKIYQVTDQYKKAYGDIVNGLTDDEKRIVAQALDGQLKVPIETFGEKVKGAYVGLRAMATRLADLEGLPEPARLKDYFPHVLESEYLQQFKKDGSITLPDEGITVKPTEIPYHLRRFMSDADARSYDLDSVFNVRISTGVRKAYVNPILRYATEMLRDIKDPRVNRYMQLYLDKIQGRPIPFEKSIADAISDLTSGRISPRQVLKGSQSFSRWINMRYYISLCGASLKTAFKEFYKLQNTGIEVGPKNLAKGLMNFFTPRGIKAFKDSGIMNKMNATIEAQMFGLSSKRIFGKIERAILSPLQAQSWLSRGIAFHSGLAEAAEQGLTGPMAIRHAMLTVDRTQFPYGAANKSPYLNHPLGNLAYQFSTYPTNQIAFWRHLMTSPGDMKMGGVTVPVSAVKACRLLIANGILAGGCAYLGVKGYEASGAESLNDLTGKNLGFAGKIPIPMVGTVHGLAKHFTTLPSPAIQLATGIPEAIAGNSYRLKESGLNLLAGALMYPRNAANNTMDLMGNLNRGYEVKKSYTSGMSPRSMAEALGTLSAGHTTIPYEDETYPLTKGQAVAKYFGLKPQPQQDYEESRRH
jgi:hypothetical protein